MRKLFIVISTVFLTFTLFSLNVFASMGRIDCTDKTINVGDVIDLPITYQFPNKSTAKFSVVSSNSSVAQFNLLVFDAGSDYSGVTSGSKSAQLTGLKPGTILLVASNVDVVENSSEKSVSLTGGCTITVVNKTANNNNNNSNSNNTPNSPSKPNEGEVSPLKKSPNNLLSKLTIDNGKLKPEFNSRTYSYTVELDSSSKKVNIVGVLADSKATSKNLKQTINWENKEQTVTINIVAENGTKSTYTIKFIPKKEVAIQKTYQNVNYTLILSDERLSYLDHIEKTVDKNKYDVFVKNNIIYAVAKDNAHDFLAKLDDNLNILELYNLLVINKEVFALPINGNDISNTDKGLVKSSFKFENQDVSGYRFEDPKLNKYALISAYKLGSDTLERYVVNTDNNTSFNIGESLLISDSNYTDLLNKFQKQLDETNKTKVSQQNDKRIYLLAIMILCFIASFLGLIAVKYKRLYNKIDS